MNVFAAILFFASLAPVDIVQSAVELSQKAEIFRTRYGFTQETIERSGDKTTTKVYEISFDNGKQYRRLTYRNGKAVDEKPEPYTRGDKNRHEMLAELTKAFDYTFGPEERVDGYDCWQLIAKPKPGYDPPSMRTSFLKYMEGKVWIAKDYKRLVRVDAQTTGPVSFGWFLMKLAAGTRIYMEQARIDDDVWLLKRFKMTYDARVLFKNVKGQIETTSTNFRRTTPST